MPRDATHGLTILRPTHFFWKIAILLQNVGFDGMPSLRRTIAAKFEPSYGLRVDPGSEVTVCGPLRLPQEERDLR